MKYGKVLGLLGLCRKAGKLAIGEKPAGTACKDGSAVLLVLASDASENTVKKAIKCAGLGNVPCKTLPFSKEELGNALGRSVCAVAAVMDEGFSAALQSAAYGDKG